MYIYSLKVAFGHEGHVCIFIILFIIWSRSGTCWEWKKKQVWSVWATNPFASICFCCLSLMSKGYSTSALDYIIPCPTSRYSWSHFHDQKSPNPPWKSLSRELNMSHAKLQKKTLSHFFFSIPNGLWLSQPQVTCLVGRLSLLPEWSGLQRHHLCCHGLYHGGVALEGL